MFLYWTPFEASDNAFLPVSKVWIFHFSFHVGTGCSDPKAYEQCISDARLVFEMASEFGYKMWLLDIGGGFPGTDDSRVRFEEVKI